MSSLPLALHIPDGFLSGTVAGLAAVLAIAAVGYGLRTANRDLDESKVPLLGVVAAFIFAAQMLNFPIAGGTSGHLLGATLAAVLLGPWLACLVMAVVITVQAFGFADGGVTALGANVLNMGVLGAVLAGFVLKAGAKLLPRSRPAFLGRRDGDRHPASGGKLLPRSRPAFLGLVGVVSWVAVMIGAAATAVELALSGTVPLGTVLAAMLGVHALIGIGEAVITVAAVGAVLSTRPDLIAIGRFEPLAPVPTARPAEGV